MFARRRPKRANGEIDKLQPELKDSVDQMLLAGKSYREIVEYLADHEIILSQMAVCRYARRYLASVEQLKIASENMRMMMDELDKYPDIDTTEAILRVASNNVFNAMTALPAESWEGVDPEKLLREATGLIRAAGYKRKVDREIRTDTDKALAANQALLYDVLSKKHPELYDRLMDVIAAEKDLQDT